MFVEGEAITRWSDTLLSAVQWFFSFSVWYVTHRIVIVTVEYEFHVWVFRSNRYYKWYLLYIIWCLCKRLPSCKSYSVTIQEVFIVNDIWYRYCRFHMINDWRCFVCTAVTTAVSIPREESNLDFACLFRPRLLKFYYTKLPSGGDM